MNFGQAIEALKEDKRVSRSGWNGKGMFIFLRKGRVIQNVAKHEHMVAGTDNDWFESCDHICMRSAQGLCVVGWLASQTDMLAEDWQIV